MSSREATIIQDSEYINRFIEVCGTSKPTEIARKLDISYQAARNYLSGRYPDANVLITIANRTAYSINWLLTGNGRKFALGRSDVILLTDEVRTAIRLECENVVNELLRRDNDDTANKVIMLSPNEILEEKLREKEESVSLKVTSGID